MLVKKSLRWAENLENTSMNSTCVLSSPALAPLIEKEVDEPENDLSGLSSSRRKMRRSYSTSDMNKFLLSHGIEVSNVEEHASLISSVESTMMMMLPPKPADDMMHLNVTYDKTNVISPSRVVNSSFMDSSSILAGPALSVCFDV